MTCACQSTKHGRKFILSILPAIFLYVNGVSCYTFSNLLVDRRTKLPVGDSVSYHKRNRRKYKRQSNLGPYSSTSRLLVSVAEEQQTSNQSLSTDVYFAEFKQNSVEKDEQILNRSNSTAASTNVPTWLTTTAEGRGSLSISLLPIEKLSIKSEKGKSSSRELAENSTDNCEPSDDCESMDAPSETRSLHRLWKRRHARTLEEGIRRERSIELSDLLMKAQIDTRRQTPKRFVARTLMGLVNALAEEVEDLDIELSAQTSTPFWRKSVNEIRINFSRLGFKPLRMGGSDKYDLNGEVVMKEVPSDEYEKLGLVESADEAFSRIDKDKSGTLDREEIAEALSMISDLETDKDSFEKLASELVALYDDNSDGVVDRAEYQQMVEDMAMLRPNERDGTLDEKGFLNKVRASVQSISKGISERAARVAAVASGSLKDEEEVDPNELEMGSIILSGLNLDLRRLVFGGLLVVKRFTPGGPLILEPFTATVRGSFTREDVMGSFLLDSGLKLLVARVIRLRVRSFRDVVDGAYFFGRQWKLTSKTAPVVQVLDLSNVEFVNDKMILTGRARVRTSPEAPIVTNTFKVRTRIGTQNDGQSIGLIEPELAFVFECPQAIENGLSVLCKSIGIPPPRRPDPVYSFFPIYSPFKVNENTGFDMGEDNQLRKIFVKDGKLRFEMRSVLRPGRFLGNHYLAFTIPNRTFILTMDRVREGIRVARQNKRIAAREKQLLDDTSEVSQRDYSARRILRSLRNFTTRRDVFRSIRLRPKQPKPKSFFARFVEGYTLLEREGEAKNERLTSEISDWFGRQGSSANATLTEKA